MSTEPSDLRDRFERLQVLHNISTALSATDDPREVLTLVLREAVRVTQASSGSLVLINPSTGHFNHLRAHPAAQRRRAEDKASA